MSVDMTTEELKRLAASITPGPWNSSIHGSQVLTGDSWNTICEIRVRKDFSAAQWEDGRGSSDPTANARAIALVPDLLRELIERREADAPLTAREAEPVAWAETYDGGNHYNTVSLTKTRHHTVPLYAHPPQSSEAVAEALQLADDMFRDLGWHSKYEITSAALRALSSGEASHD